MKISKLAGIFLLLPLTALAGKAEREMMSNDVEPAVKAATTSLKTACGCDVKFNIKADSFQTTDDLFKIKYFASTIKDNAAAYCTDPASKKAICKMKSIEFSKAASTTLTFAGSKVTATTDGTSQPSWEMLTREVDK
ncbi:hypothetical protein H8L32_10370 [Undibacterium sp. CY18W]|uniref:Uncharacterized protein n=1 Tax=Undibacterium hunanense TaxID=2762292 RepID=A0ABR6ZPU7_9BURK|nr:hypothetical protein [Undibacterium hunanense]MBC3917878.1 hypothetical protein [Undibacterium hunanense]